MKKMGEKCSMLKRGLAVCCMVLSVLFFCSVKTYAEIPSQITDYKPQVEEVKVSGTVTNSEGETVDVTITHPGVGMTKTELDNMRDHVRAGDEPWTSAFNAFAADARSRTNPRTFYEWNDDFVYVPNVWTNSARKEYVTIRGNKDGIIAVNQAVMWYITGNDVYRGNCMTIIRNWSRIQSITPEKDFRWGITAYHLAFAAEIMRYSECETEDYLWTDEDTEKFNHFLNQALGTSRYTTQFWMNQQCFANMGIMATAVFQDDFELYGIAVEQTTVNRNGHIGGNNGSIKYQCRLMTVNEETGEAIPEDKQTIQLIEAGRDQGHTWATVSGLSTLAQSFYVQGTLVDPVTGEISNDDDAVNLFNFLDDRLVKGVTTALRYNLGYDDEWITADSSRGFYRAPSEASWRGRINPCLGILYNYYRYVEKQDMTSDEFKDIAKAYELYMPEVTSSDDFPLAATLLYTPSEAKDNYTKRTSYAETDYVKQIENFTGDISGSPKTITEGDVTYVRTTPGTELVTNSGWPKEANMGIRVRSEGTAKIEVRREWRTNGTKTVFNIPDTKGEWITIVNDISDTAYHTGTFAYYKVLGDAGYVDIDYVDFNAEASPQAAITCMADCVTEVQGGKKVYLLPAGKESVFLVDSNQGNTVFYADSAINNYSADNINNKLTITPVIEEGEVQSIYVALLKGEIASVSEVLVRTYKDKETLVASYEKEYYPDTAEYTETSKAYYESAKQEFLNATEASEQTALKKYVEAFHRLEGVLAKYDFETIDANKMTDDSGHGNDGMLFRNATIAGDSELASNVLVLDGSVNTYAELPQGILNDCDEFTIEFDVKPDKVEGNYYTYGIGSDTTNYTYFKTMNEQLALCITNSSNTAELGAEGVISACNGKWMHVKVVYEKERLSIYQDGSFIGSADTSLKLSDLGNDLKFYLGKSLWLWDDYFAGSFDNIKIYNYALNKEEIDPTDREVTITYVIGEGAYVTGETVQKVKVGESAQKITLIPYPGYTFVGWSDGSTSLERCEKYVARDMTLYAGFKKEPEENSTVVSYDFESVNGLTVRDTTGNGNYITLYGNTSVVEEKEKQSKVLYLDGSTDTYARIPSGTLDGMNSMTIQLDVKAVKADKAKNYWLMAIGQNDTRYYMLKPNADSVRSAITIGSWKNESGTTAATKSNIKDVWTRLSIVFDDTTMRIYQDGVLLDEVTDIPVKISDLETDMKIYIGKSFFSADEYFEGYVDNISIHNYAMSEEEIAQANAATWKLTYIAGSGGKIEGEVSQEVENGSTGSKVTAVAKDGYRFVSWSDGNTNAERVDANVTGNKSVSALFERIKIIDSEGLVADYEMVYTAGGVLQNKASLNGRLDAKLINMTSADFGMDDGNAVMKFVGDSSKYVELPEGLLGDDETFSIETTFSTETKANHWLYTIGSIADGANYFFVNPMSTNGKMLIALKDKTTEYRILEGANAIEDGCNTVTTTFDHGKVCIYLNGTIIAEKETGYSIKDILKNGTANSVCGFIGKSLYSNDPAFTGRVRSFKVFDCVLEAERVANRYAETETDDWVEASDEKCMQYYLNFDGKNLKDNSGNERNAQMKVNAKNLVTYVRGSESTGKAIRLNRNRSKSCIQITSTDNLLKEDMTISFRMKAPKGGITEEQGILSFTSENAEDGSAVMLSTATEYGGLKRALQLTVWDKTVTSAKSYYTELSVHEVFPEDEWVQVTVTYDGTPKIYRNGKSLALTQDMVERSRSEKTGYFIGTAQTASKDDTYLSAYLDEIKLYDYAWNASAVSKEMSITSKEQIAEFDFDSLETGFSGYGALATMNGTTSIIDDETRGKVLSLDGKSFMDVTTANGESLLTGVEEMTVSYYGKADKSGANWPFYAAPNAKTQADPPTYIGIIDNIEKITVERHNNGRKATAVTGSSAEWKHVVVVFQKGTIKIYVDAKCVAITENVESLIQILGESSILQIGKANWVNGEFYTGLLDDYCIYNYAMTEEQVQSIGVEEESEKETYVVAYEASEGGKIQGNTVQRVEEGADGTRVTAVALEGYEFAGWSDGLKTVTRNESNVTQNHYYRALFESLSEEQPGDEPVQPGEQPNQPEDTNSKRVLSECVVSEIPKQYYTGSFITPTVTVKYHGTTLVKNQDYKLSYNNNLNIGTANVVITGIGSYEGSLTRTFTIGVKKNAVYTVGNYKYAIVNEQTDGNGTVAITGVKDSKTKKKLKKITIFSTVKIGGKNFIITTINTKAFSDCIKVTAVTIGKNVTTIKKQVFNKCTSLKKITIKGTKLKKVQSGAFKGMNKKQKIQVKVPKKKLKAYKKLLKNKGLPKNTTIK